MEEQSCSSSLQLDGDAIMRMVDEYMGQVEIKNETIGDIMWSLGKMFAIDPTIYTAWVKGIFLSNETKIEDVAHLITGAFEIYKGKNIGQKTLNEFGDSQNGTTWLYIVGTDFNTMSYVHNREGTIRSLKKEMACMMGWSLDDIQYFLDDDCS